MLEPPIRLRTHPFEPKPGPGPREDLPGHWSTLMLALGDDDYVVYNVFSRMPFMLRIGLFHLQQALEKYLKAIYMAHHNVLPKSLQSHNLQQLLAKCSRLEPRLGDPTLETFCRRMQDYSDLARYPEERRPYLAFRGFNGDIDRALLGIRAIAMAATDQRDGLIERITEERQEWNPKAGFLYGVELQVAAAIREALLDERPDVCPPRI